MKKPEIEIRARQLQLGYDNQAVFSSDTLELRGNSIAIIGHNGAGKSTFMKSMLGLLPPLQGALDITHFATEASEARTNLVPEEHMAFCPETGSVFADLKVEEYLRMWCRIKHGKERYYMKEGSDYMELLNITPLLRKFGRELSKGQRRRVQTAIGFLINPKLFLFDEPFDGLDVQKTSELSDILREHQHKMCFCVSSHRMDVVERLSDRILVLDDGAVLAAGSLSEVIAALCGGGVQIGGCSDVNDLEDQVGDFLPESIVTAFSSDLRVTAQLEDLERLKRFLQEKHAGGFREIEDIRPSLTDAMNYHLQHTVAKQSNADDSKLLQGKEERSNLISIVKLLKTN